MSRSFTRALLVAPLLATALMLSACGGDDAPDGATATAPAGTTAEVVTTTPTDTTPASTPEASSDDARKGDEKEDEATPAPDAGGAADGAAAPSAAADASQAEAPEKLRPSAERAQNEVIKVLTAIETCWTTTSDYSKCASPDQVSKFGGDVVDTKQPKPTEVAITRSTKSTFKIIGTDKAGTRWVLSKSKSGEVTRKCKLASGKSCKPASW
ncbi:MAG: hypothetical protein Q7T55_26230 [Solirubrobacteraceae bacterium]|nr:hypothetical protein [Solirubrobacteraceae bacterium]